MLTNYQEITLIAQIEEMRNVSTKLALHKNDAIFKFLNALNAFGFIDAEKYAEFDERRRCALMKISYKGASK